MLHAGGAGSAQAANCLASDRKSRSRAEDLTGRSAMRQTAKRTWSQQELAIKLHVAEPERPRWLSWERRRLLIHAGKTALAAALCWWIGSRFGLHDGYWGAISAIIVLQSNFGATITASRDRILGTVIGAVLGFSFSLLRRGAVELHTGRVCGDRDLRLAGVPVRVRGWRASPSPSSCWCSRVPQRPCGDSRGAGGSGHRGGGGGEYAGVSRSRAPATARRPCSGVSSARVVL